jgi:hypothetical protein
VTGKDTLTGWMQQKTPLLTRDEINPTADLAIALADGDQQTHSDEALPPDDVWVPQLYAEFGIVDTARISGLPVHRVRAILAQRGVTLRGRGRPRKAA